MHLFKKKYIGLFLFAGYFILFLCFNKYVSSFKLIIFINTSHFSLLDLLTCIHSNLPLFIFLNCLNPWQVTPLNSALAFPLQTHPLLEF